MQWANISIEFEVSTNFCSGVMGSNGMDRETE